MSSSFGREPCDIATILVEADSPSVLRHFNSVADQLSISIRWIPPFESKLLWEDLSGLYEEITQSNSNAFFVAGSITGITGLLSVGYVIWTVRSGLLDTSLIAHLPAWSLVDPLLVLSDLRGDDDDDDESLDEMLDKYEQESIARPPMAIQV